MDAILIGNKLELVQELVDLLVLLVEKVLLLQ